MISLFSFPHSLISLVCFLILPSHVVADPATVPFQDCFDPGSNISQKFNVSTIYAQVLQDEVWGHYLNLTVLGESPEDILGLTNTSSSLATLFTTTSVLTLSAWSNSSYLCQNLRPPSPLPAMDPNANTFCPIPAGPFAMSSTIPWGANRELTTLNTRLRAVDPFGQELVCLDVFTTPLAPHPHSPYGRAKNILWSTVALAIAYWFVIGIARIVSAWNRGISRPGRGLWGRAQSAGFILASAISGERLATSPALMRFSTPCLRDVIFHTQWCAILAMVAVQWPQFVYPLLTQAAWSTLSYNISLTEGSKLHHWNPLATSPFSPPADFSAQLADSNSPLYIDPTVPNVLFNLPENATDGMFSFAYTLGLRPQDLFPTCLILFLSIIGVTMTLSILVWFIDLLVSLIPGAVIGSGHGSNSLSRFAGSRSPVFGAKEMGSPPVTAEERSLTALSDKQLHNRFGLPLSSSSSGPVERGINSHRAWWRFRSDIGAFHTNVLHGNLVRILVLFHLPVTIFSCYQMTLPRSQASLSSITLAAFSFIFVSILIPLHLVVRVTLTTTNKLYDETRTLLSLGPLYNHYRHGSQLFACLLFATNIAFGVTIGAGQKSGTAQAIVILVVEVVSALVTSIWLPWGSGASMGLISFLFCVARIVVAVLLVILAPTISIGPGPGGWVAYGILIILALVYLALVLMLLVKIIEAIVRIVGGIGFDRSKHVVDSGLIGACSLLGCCGGPKKRRRPKGKNTRYRATDLQQPTARRNSDLSSYNPPIPMALGNDSVTTAPKFLGPESRQGSGSQPPSVLKPEHVNRPYKEDTDDEGFIMGAWKPYPPTGYIPVTDGPQTSAPESIHSPTLPKASSSTPTSGFSRVGGGRANMDTPYAINTGTGSTQTFPSIGQQSTTMLVPPVFPDDDDPPLPLTSLRQPEQGLLPPGGMQPVHIRTKSQTAIIEDAGWVYPAGAIASGSSPLRSQLQLQQAAETLLHPPPSSRFTLNVPDDDDDSVEDHQQKKKWYNFRKSRPHSSEGRTSTSALSSTAQVDAELGGAGDTPSPQRSFVVIRKPPGSMGRLNQAIAAASAASDNAATSVPLARPPTR